MFNKLFWKDAFERMVSTGAQAVLTVFSLDATNAIGAHMDLKLAAATFGFGMLFALLKCLAALGLTSGNSASLVVDNVKEKKSNG